MKIRFILLRGLGREQQHWGELISHLTTTFPNAKIDTPDLAGSGVLNEVNSPLKIEDYIPYLTEQLEPLSPVSEKEPSKAESTIDKEVTVLIGLSLGGMIALHWYAQQPHFFTHLILINSSSQLNSIYERLKLPNVIAKFTALMSSNITESETARYQLTCNKAPMSEALIKDWVDIQHAHPMKLANLTKQLCAASLFTPPTLHDLESSNHENKLSDSKNTSNKRNITVFASKNDQLVDVCCSETLAAYYEADIVYHPWAGHDIPQDDPQWFCEKLNTSIGSYL